MEEIVSKKLKEFSTQFREEMGRMFSKLMERFSTPPPSKGIQDGARKNAPKAPAPKSDAGGRPVPVKKGKGKKDGAEKGSEPKPAAQKAVAPRKTVRDKTTAPPSKTAPPPSTAGGKDGTMVPWTEVVGRKAKTRALKEAGAREAPKLVSTARAKGPAKTPGPANTKGQAKKKKARRRAPRTAAVVLTCPKGQYAETMAEVRAKIGLSEVGIQGGITTRIAATGAIVIEVPGSENGPKADALASRMREVLKDKEGVRVDRPTKTAEVRVRGLECSIKKSEVVEAVAEKGTCQSYEIQAGEIRGASESQGSLWLKLPLAAAKKAAEGGTLQVGWTRAKIALLEARPLRCFRCLEKGHVREKCPGSQDRSDKCYRCGGSGHIARECAAPPRCPICVDLGRKADHALGSQQCAPRRKKGRTGYFEGRKTNPPSAQKTSAPTTTAPAMRENAEEPPKPQRVLRSRAGGSKTPSASSSKGEEPMETEPLEEGGDKRE